MSRVERRGGRWTERRGWWAPLLLLVVAAAAEIAPLSAQDGGDPEVAEWIRSRVEGSGPESPIRVAGAPIRAAGGVARFYEGRGFRPAWLEAGVPGPSADSLARTIALATRDGLHPDDYHLPSIRAALAEVRGDGRAGTSPDQRRLAELDLLLTDAFLTYGAHLVNGRVDPVAMHPEWSAARTEEDLVALLGTTLAAGRVGAGLETLLPNHPGYARLRQALEDHRQVVDAGGWPVVPGRTLRPGTRDPAVPVLRERLRLSGDLPPDTAVADPELFDDALSEAVRRFQRRHGLDPDGAAGLETSGLLNVPAETRIRQIELSLERWRWLPRDLGERHVVVNIAGFRVDVMEGDSSIFSSRVMVGQPYRRTPVFSDLMTYLVLNPTWTIPPNIMEVDKLPLIRRDPGYLKENRIRVLAPDGREVSPSTVDWATLTGETRYLLRMDPGPENPLGQVKFMFPNPYFIYLHDTPDRDLFDRTDRAFSSGCIRVERPLELAALLLRDAGWDQARIEKALENPGERTIPLARPIPVHLLYWTAWVDPDGTVQFREDPYQRDAALDAALRLPAPTTE